MWKEIAEKLELLPLEQEGGLFKSSYRSNEIKDGRHAYTAIYYMLTGEGYSHLHVLESDEIYHYYKGDPVELLELHPDGTSRVIILGNDILAGQKVQHRVSAGVWQGSRILGDGEYALLGTTMAPGFADEEYVHATDIEGLLKKYPEQKELILKLTGEVKYT